MKQIKDIKNKLKWEEYYDPTFDWDCIIYYKNSELTEDFIREFKDKVDWHNISKCQTLSEDFIREFQNKVEWKNISFNQKLSEDFIREFKDKVDWKWISCKQKLSEDFVKEFQDKVDWKWISNQVECELIGILCDFVAGDYNQKSRLFSEDFVKEFKDKLDLKKISELQETLNSKFPENKKSH